VRLVVAITGASGAIYGLRALEELRALGVETHVIVSRWGERTIEHETSYSLAEARALASEWHSWRNQAAVVSSGSFHVDGMLVAPCSMRTLAAIAHGISDTLVVRAADVALKERRRLALLVRETPLTEIHLANMLTVTRAGAIVVPPVPAFYNQPRTLDDVVNHTVARALDLFGLEMAWTRRWSGQLQSSRTATKCSGEAGA
jgi:4-hydroxy-3-polyprenylbenzoate decarboxylase